MGPPSVVTQRNPRKEVTMKGQCEMTAAARAAASIRSCRLAIVLAASGLAVLSGCGGGDRLSREEFSTRMQGIHQQGGELWGRLAEQAGDLKPDQPLPANVREPMDAMVEFQRSTAEELEGLDVPQGADEEVQEFVDALRERTRLFEQAAQAGRFTEQDFEEVVRAGDRIDYVFRQLRAEGFLPRVDEHEDS